MAGVEMCEVKTPWAKHAEYNQEHANWATTSFPLPACHLKWV